MWPILGLMPSLDADFYALLRVDPRATSATIRAAWAVEQRLWGVRQNAPDLATRHEAERHVQLLGEVKDVLLDPRRRANYDRERSASARPQTLPRQDPSPPPSPPPSPRGRGTAAAPVLMHQGYAARHPELTKPLAVGLAGGLITGSQVLHWDLPLMVAIVALLCMPVYAFDVLGLRSAAWTFRTRARGIASWVVLVALTLYGAASVLSRM